jgi:hypothetical protein
LLEHRESCGHESDEGWCEYCVNLWKEAYEKGVKEGSEKKTGYMCKTDYYFELGSSGDATQIFSTYEGLKQNKKCWSECGVVEIEIAIKRHMS